MERRRVVRGVPTIAVAAVAGCLGESTGSNDESDRPPIEEVEIAIFDVRKPDTGLQSATLPVILELENPAEEAVPSPSGELDASINGEAVVTAEPSVNTLEPGETAKANLDLIVEYADGGAAVADALRSGRFRLEMTGKIRSEGATESVSLSHEYGG